MKKKQGKVVTPAACSPWPHEMRMAKILAEAGSDVKFIVKREGKKINSADIFLGDEIWEMKAPDGKTLDSVERNLRRGSAQSDRVVFASWRMKGVPDEAILRELKSSLARVERIKRLKFINRHREIIDIK